MDNKKFYIVPTTQSYYDEVSADSAEEAVVDFATNMDMDMSAYFKAVKKADMIHGYANPSNMFEESMNKIVEKEDAEKIDIFSIVMMQRAYDVLPTSLKVTEANSLSKILDFYAGESNWEYHALQSLDMTISIEGLWKVEEEVEDVLKRHTIDFAINDSWQLLINQKDYETVKGCLDDLGLVFKWSVMGTTQ